MLFCLDAVGCFGFIVVLLRVFWCLCYCVSLVVFGVFWHYEEDRVLFFNMVSLFGFLKSILSSAISLASLVLTSIGFLADILRNGLCVGFAVLPV